MKSQTYEIGMEERKWNQIELQNLVEEVSLEYF